MLNLSNLNVDIEGSRILTHQPVGRGRRTCLSRRAQRRWQDHNLSQHYGLSPRALGRYQLRRLRPDEAADLANRATRYRLFARRVRSLYRPDRGREYRASTWTRPSGRPAAARIEEAYTVFPKLRQYLARGGAQLSGGERKMVSIARH